MNELVFLTVKHHFSAGHRIPGLAGAGAKCANLHGHTFGVEWTFQVGGLDATEFEYAEAKAVLRGWVDVNFDHGFLVAPHDEHLIDFLKAEGHKWHPVPPMPTTEAIASMLLAVANSHPGVGAPCTQVLVTEGPHNEARVVARR
ncbi:QueD-like 6-pyruvoyl-tetrahydropterin synthase [Mycolicibacterium phage Vic9]